MVTPSFTVECPCCKAKLTLDPELQAVIAHEAPPPTRSVDDLGAAFDKLRARSAEREERFKEQLRGEGELVDVRALARSCALVQTHAAERRLLERVGEALARVEALPPSDRHEVRAVLATLTSGMIFDLTRFPGEDTKGLAAIESLEE